MSTSTRATGPDESSRRFLRIRSGRLPSAAVQQIAAELGRGAVVIFPTETVYGMGTNAFSPQGIRKIYQLKGRAWRKPLALLVPSLEAAGPLLNAIPDEAYRLAEEFWPGPLTLVFQASPLGKLVTGGLETIAVRVPNHPMAMTLLRSVGLPLACTSVNRSGDDPAISGDLAHRLFGAEVDWFIHGGTCRVKTASSVVDLSHFPFTISREGSIGKKRLEKNLFNYLG